MNKETRNFVRNCYRNGFASEAELERYQGLVDSMLEKKVNQGCHNFHANPELAQAYLLHLAGIDSKIKVLFDNGRMRTTVIPYYCYTNYKGGDILSLTGMRGVLNYFLLLVEPIDYSNYFDYSDCCPNGGCPCSMD